MSYPNIVTNVGNYVKPDSQMPKLKGQKESWYSKDKPFHMLGSALSPNAGDEHIIEEFSPISSQGRAGSCVANAWCDALEILMGIELGLGGVVQLSRRFLYWTARSLHGATDRDEGTYIRAGGHQLRKIGVIPERMMPYADHTSAIVGKDASPKLEHYTQASNNRITSFYRLNQSKDDMLLEADAAIRANHPIVIGVPVTREFQQSRSLETFDVPGPDNLGRHAMIVVGVKNSGGKRTWLLRNSWGEDWGHLGHCWITDEYLATSIDSWVGTRMSKLR